MESPILIKAAAINEVFFDIKSIYIHYMHLFFKMYKSFLLGKDAYFCLEMKGLIISIAASEIIGLLLLL